MKLFKSPYRAFFACLLLVLSVPLTAQNAADAPSFVGSTDFKVGLSFDGFSNAGLFIGAEHYLLESIRTKEKRKGMKTVRRQLLVHGNLGYTTHFSTATQNGINAYSGFILRRVNNKSRELFIALNPLGVYRSVLTNTYEVVDESVSRISLPGRSYYAPSVAIGIGRFRKATKRSGWHLSLQANTFKNYNAEQLVFLSLHFGRRF